MSEGAGVFGVELVEALEDLGDTVGGQGVVGGLSFASSLPAFRCCRRSCAPGTGKGARPHTNTFASAAGHEGNILAETSVTTPTIDSTDIPR